MPPLQGLADHHQECVGRRSGLLVAGLDAQNSLRDESIDELRIIILQGETTCEWVKVQCGSNDIFCRYFCLQTSALLSSQAEQLGLFS